MPEARAPPPVELRWSAPAGCPDRDEVLASVDRFVTPSDAPEDWSMYAEAEVHSTEVGWVLTLDMRFPEGKLRRRIEGESCAVVAEAGALVISVLLDPRAVLAELEAQSAAPTDHADEVAGAPAPPSQEPTVTVDSPATARRRRAGRRPAPVTSPRRRARRRAAPPPLHAVIGLDGLASFGALPRWGGGPGLTAGLERGLLRAELRSTLDSPQRAVVPPTAGGASILVWSTGALACLAPGRDRLRVPLCLGPELGWLRARGIGLDQPLTVHRLLLELVGSAALTYAVLPWLRLRARADGVLVLTPHRLVVEDLGPVHRTRRTGVRLGLGLELRLPPPP